MFRPAEHLVHGINGPCVVLDGQVCAILDQLLSLDKVGRQYRGQSEQLDHSLRAIRLAGAAYTQSSCKGTKSAPTSEPDTRSQRQLNDTVSTTTAASILGLTNRAVVKAINEKRLIADKPDGRWRITRKDLHEFQTRKRNT